MLAWRGAEGWGGQGRARDAGGTRVWRGAPAAARELERRLRESPRGPRRSPHRPPRPEHPGRSPENSSTGCASSWTGPPSKGAKGTFHSLTVQSVEQETAASPSGVTLMPRTGPVWPTRRRRQRLAGTSHSRTSPSAAPDSRQLRRRGLRARHVTPSSWASAARKGLANTRSSLAARGGGGWEEPAAHTSARQGLSNEDGPEGLGKPSVAAGGVAWVRQGAGRASASGLPPLPPAAAMLGAQLLPAQASTHPHSARACTPWPSQTGAAPGPGCGAPGRAQGERAGRAGMRGNVSLQQQRQQQQHHHHHHMARRCSVVRAWPLHAQRCSQRAGHQSAGSCASAAQQLSPKPQLTLATSCDRSRVYASSLRLIVLTFMPAAAAAAARGRRYSRCCCRCCCCRCCAANLASLLLVLPDWRPTGR